MSPLLLLLLLLLSSRCVPSPLLLLFASTSPISDPTNLLTVPQNPAAFVIVAELQPWY